MGCKSESGLKLGSPPVADYMKIRQYVVAMTERDTSPQSMLPSMNELARHFGVTRMTVHKALKDLIKDKYLVTRKGIGTFINPEWVREKAGEDHPLFFGIVVGNGKHCLYDAYYCDWISALGKAVTAHPWSVKIINITSREPEDIAKEIKDSFVDGVIWLDPYDKNAQKALKLLRIDKFPAVAVQLQIDGVDCVGVDWEMHAYEIGKELLKEGRRSVVFADYRDIQPITAQLKGLKKAFEDARVKFNEGLVLRKPESLEEDFAKILELGIDIQAVYISGPNLRKILRTLEKLGIDTKMRCRLVAEPFLIAGVPDFCGIVRKYPFEEIANAAIEILTGRKEVATRGAESRLFAFSTEKRGEIQ